MFIDEDRVYNVNIRVFNSLLGIVKESTELWTVLILLIVENFCGFTSILACVVANTRDVSLPQQLIYA